MASDRTGVTDEPVVIDTMIFTYALLGVPEFCEESLAVIDAAGEILVPDFFRTEFVNVVWQWVQTKGLSLEAGVEVLRDTEALVTHVTSSAVLWERALALSVGAHHPAYDTLFVALAEWADAKLVTYDAGLQRAFPDVAIHPSVFLK